MEVNTKLKGIKTSPLNIYINVEVLYEKYHTVSCHAFLDKGLAISLA